MLAIADEAQQVPDLSKAFPTEKLIGKMFVNEIEYFNFNTDLEYVQLKAKLITYLGNDWTESPLKEPQTDREIKLRNLYEGKTTFNNAKFPEIKIDFAVKKSRAGKKFIAMLHIAKV